MNSYITWGDLLRVILALAIGDVLAHIGSDLARLAWQRHRNRQPEPGGSVRNDHEQGTGDKA